MDRLTALTARDRQFGLKWAASVRQARNRKNSKIASPAGLIDKADPPSYLSGSPALGRGNAPVWLACAAAFRIRFQGFETSR
jgi:hypothetical protein